LIHLLLGRFTGSEKEAAEAYDVAAIKFRGPNAVTNFEMSKYDLKTIENCILPIGAAKRLKAEAESAVEGSVNNGRSTDEECTLSSQTDSTSYIGNAARTEWLPLISLQQQSNPSQVAYELQKVPLYNQDLHMQLHNVNQQKYIQASGSTHELRNLISLGSAVNNNNNNASSSTPGIYTNISNALAINGLLVANPSDRSAVIFGENSEGSAAAKCLTFGNMLMPPEHFARNNLYYLPPSSNISNLLVLPKPPLIIWHITTGWKQGLISKQGMPPFSKSLVIHRAKALSAGYIYIYIYIAL
jgi:hypothetical protein